MQETKHCNGCGQDKPLSEFRFCKSGRKAGKPRSRCTTCEKLYGKNYRETHPKSEEDRLLAAKCAKSWREANREHYLKMNKDYYYAHKSERYTHTQLWYHTKGGRKPLLEAIGSSAWFGEIVERILRGFFDSLEQMPHGHPGYDYICGKGYTIDAKGSSLLSFPGRASNWSFCIRQNKKADYFLCLAMDSRESLTPMHVWLIPGNVINHLTRWSIANLPESLAKWAKYERPLDKVMECRQEVQVILPNHDGFVITTEAK